MQHTHTTAHKKACSDFVHQFPPANKLLFSLVLSVYPYYNLRIKQLHVIFSNLLFCVICFIFAYQSL